MVKHQEEKYGWHFTYIGANQDAFTEAQKMGMQGVNYKATGQGTQSMYSAVSKNVSANRSSVRGQSVNMTQEDIDNS